MPRRHAVHFEHQRLAAAVLDDVHAGIVGADASDGAKRKIGKLLRGDRRFGAGETPSVEVVSFYWHFVDVVWIALWATLFLLQ